MPNLPTFNVVDPAYSRLLVAFNSDPVEYRAWLKVALREEVTRRELRTLNVQQDAARSAVVRDVSTNVLP